MPDLYPAPAARVLPVIHFSTIDLALLAADVASEAGAAGVFLIEMQGRDGPLARIGQSIKARHPGLLVGVNHLSLGPAASLTRSLDHGLDMTWADAAGVSSVAMTDAALAVNRALRCNPDHAFFGSVAFKYQPHEPAPGSAAVSAVACGMIPTTSGAATGSAADPGKLAVMRAAIGPTARLALASGITPSNVIEFLPYVTDILVSTGVSADEHRFDPRLLSQLVRAVTAWRGAVATAT